MVALSLGRRLEALPCVGPFGDGVEKKPTCWICDLADLGSPAGLMTSWVPRAVLKIGPCCWMFNVCSWPGLGGLRLVIVM